MTLEEAFQKFGPQLLRHASVLVGPDNAADLVSEALIGALRSKAWPTTSNQIAYLHKSVLNSARMYHRASSRRARREWIASSASVAEGFEFLPRPDVIDAVRSLSLQQRSVIYFTYWEDLPPRDVARVMGVSEGAVKKHLARGREKLRSVLDEH